MKKLLWAAAAPPAENHMKPDHIQRIRTFGQAVRDMGGDPNPGAATWNDTTGYGGPGPVR